MQMKFDEVKATQIGSLFLKLAGGKLQYLALIKLLYLLDREALNRWGAPVTTDRYVSMKLGPVTSQIYDLVKVKGEPLRPSFWSTHIRRNDYDATLLSDPDTSELSPAEEALVHEIFLSSGDKDGFTLAEEMHKRFPEWSDPGGSSSPIDISDILSALGKSEDEVSHSESIISAQNALYSLTRG